MLSSLDFWSMVKVSLGFDAINLVIWAIITLALLWWRKRSKPTAHAVANPCPVPQCRLGRGHLMPCWSGDPDPTFDARSKEVDDRPYMTFGEDGSVVFTWFGKDRRVSLILEAVPSQSSWHALAKGGSS